MDGATCLIGDNGEIVIRRHPFRNWVYLAVLSLFVVIMFLALYGALRTSQFGGLGLLLIPLLVIGAAMVMLFQSLRLSSIRMDTGTRCIKIQRRSSPDSISFSDIAFVHVVVSSAVRSDVVVCQISAITREGSSIKIGSISGQITPATQSAHTIGQMIADTVRVPLHMNV